MKQIKDLNTKRLPVFEVNNKDELREAFLIANMGFFTGFTIIVNNPKGCLGEDYWSAIEGCLDEAEYFGGLSTAQQRVFSYKYYFEESNDCVVIEGYIRYYLDETDKNKLFGKCGDIVFDLTFNFDDDETVIDPFLSWHSWLSENIHYEHNDDTDDYSALETLEKGHGVCMAITALTCRVFECMGYPSVAVFGKYDGKDHCWNMIKRNGKWHHYDFTHSLGVKEIPCTDIYNGKEGFGKQRKWDKKLYSAEACEDYVLRRSRVRKKAIKLTAGSCEISIGDIKMLTDKPAMKIKNGEPVTDLSILFTIWGGGCEFSYDEYLFMAYTYDNNSFILQPDDDFDNEPDGWGYYSLEVLKRLRLDIKYLTACRNEIMIRF